MAEVDIEILEQDGNSYYQLKGKITNLLLNRRLMLSLNRMGAIKNKDEILIPFISTNEISVFQNLKQTLQKFQIVLGLSEEVIVKVESYHREDDLFDEFSKKAGLIRNDQFKDNPDLVEDFKNFKSVLKRELSRTLYPLQLLSSFHMAFAQNACNFAVPGAGKTSIVYGAYAFLKSLPDNDPRKVDKLLVVGPLSSFAPWEKEYRSCFNRDVKSVRLSGNSDISRERKEEMLYSSNPAELTLIFHGGVSNLQQEILDYLKSNKVMVVVDEAHRIKNPDGVWGRSAVEISREAISRIILTGTPVPNGYEDLYNLYQFIYPFKFKDILGFHYANLCELTRNSSPESDRVKRFTENISPFFIRIKKDDLKLPDVEEHVLSVEMNYGQREIYDFIESRYIASFKENSGGTVKDVLNRAKLIRLRQASTNPSLLSRPLKDALLDSPEFGESDPNIAFTHDSDEFIDDSEFFDKICNYSEFETPQKFIEVRNIVEKEIVAKGEKTLIWTIFIQNAKELQQYLEEYGISSRLLIGETIQSERESIIEIFNDPTNKEFSVVIANPFAVAESISLHKGCHNAIYLERDYNCSNFIQSKDRIHRVGLDKDQLTTYYYVISTNSIDSVIDSRLRQKVERMEAIIDEDIPLFSRIDDNDETDLIKALMIDYAKRT
jgi:SNF2 family DNA or RNA helicase